MRALLYTIIPIEEVIADEDAPLETLELERHGVRLLAQVFPGGEMRVERVLSTDPEDFLRADLTPGTLLSQ